MIDNLFSKTLTIPQQGSRFAYISSKLLRQGSQFWNRTFDEELSRLDIEKYTTYLVLAI